jgi:hypothetical protein
VKTARIVDYPNSSCFAPNAPSRAHRDDDYVLVLKLDERTPEGIHPLGPRLEVDPAGRGTVAPPRPNERITRTGSSSAAGSRPRRGFFLARREVFAFSTMWILQALHFAPPDYHYLWKAAGGLVAPVFIWMIPFRPGRAIDWRQGKLPGDIQEAWSQVPKATSGPSNRRSRRSF